MRGKIRIDAGFSGRTVTRFGSFERFVHWLTAGCFIILALSGLNLTFGKAIVLPLLGEGAFALLAGWGKIAHNYLSFPFMIGTALMLVIWVKDNIPGKLDLEWLKAGGGILKKGQHPPAPRFNAGQKGIFWIVIIGGLAMSVSGWHLLFPFERRPHGRRPAVLGERPCGRRDDLHRRHAGPRLHRLGRHGGRVRRHGLGRGRRELGSRASFALAGAGEEAGRHGPAERGSGRVALSRNADDSRDGRA